VKIIRYDRGGEYYERYDETRQHPGTFAKLLQKRDICAQYTMPGTLQQNGVSERRNRTLWMYALKTVMYLLNRVPSKAVSKTPLNCGQIGHLV